MPHLQREVSNLALDVVFSRLVDIMPSERDHANNGSNRGCKERREGQERGNGKHRHRGKSPSIYG
jgi:hypothetical protein